APKSGARAKAADAAAVGCAFDALGQPDWRAYETTHFVVWSCGGGMVGIDPLANGRVVTGTLAEEVFGAMQPKLAAIRDDDYPAGPEPRKPTDVYLLNLNQCRMRNGFCTPVAANALAAAVPTTPCGRNGGPLVSSAYMVIRADKVPATAPAVGTASELHA